MKKTLIGHRLLAILFDTFIVLAIIIVANIPAVISFVNVSINKSTVNIVALYIAAFFSGALSLIGIILYTIVVPVFLNGQTLGKKYFNLAIVKNNGSDIDFKTMFIRELTRFFIIIVSFGLSIIVDLITLMTSRGCSTFYDTISTTKVVDVLVE